VLCSVLLSVFLLNEVTSVGRHVAYSVKLSFQNFSALWHVYKVFGITVFMTLFFKCPFVVNSKQNLPITVLYFQMISGENRRNVYFTGQISCGCNCEPLFDTNMNLFA